MRYWPATAVRCLLTGSVLLMAVTSPQAQAGRPAPQPNPVVPQVRTALGHGRVDEARRLADTARTAASREFATALVEVFEGKDDAARPRLQTLAAAGPMGDAALELGLLELRHGRLEAAKRLLDPLVAVRTFSGPDDYFRLARAAFASREYLLANDAYDQVGHVPRADIQSAWGDLFLQHHAPGDAVTNYKKALELDPAWVPALLGLARALADDAPANAHGAFEAARKLAPNHPDLWLLGAERAVAQEDWAAARTALDGLAAARPGTASEFAIRATVAYAQGRTPELDQALARVREINPASAEGLWRVSEQAGQNYQFDAAVDYASKAVAVDGLDATAQLDLGLFELRAGDEKGARTALETSFSLDKSNQVTFNLLTMLDDLDKYTVVEDGDLIFKLPPDEAAVLKLYALPLAAEAMKTFKQHYAFTPKGPILVEIFKKHDDFAVRTIGLPGIVGALGACFGRVVSMDSPGARPPGDFSWQATLWHELAHVFTLQMSSYHVPRWLTEGISVFEEHRRNPAWGREIALQYAAAWGEGKTFGVKGLPDAFKHPENFSLAYFEASLVVEHLVNLNGDEGLRRLLTAYADGASDSDAFSKAFGKSIDDVDASFKAFVTEQYGALAAAMKTPAEAVDPEDFAAIKARAAAAPRSFPAQLALGQALVTRKDDLAAKPVLEKAAELAPQAKGNGSPHALLAQIAQRAGDPATALRELRALLVYDHENVGAARALAVVAGETKAVGDQDFALRLVADLDPFDADTHAVLGKRELANGHQPLSLIEFRAALALRPANLAEAHANVAEVLLSMGRRDEAKAEALLALREAPTYARAQELLLAAMGKGR